VATQKTMKAAGVGTAGELVPDITPELRESYPSLTRTIQEDDTALTARLLSSI
jgi:hypothetical protein